MNGGLQVKDLTVMYGSSVALDSVSLEVKPGSLTALLGPSGCGKSTLLNAVAGLLEPVDGSIEIDGKMAFADKGKKLLQPHERNIGMVFQSYALWPHMTVEENLAYPCKRRGVPKEEMAERIASTLASVHCSALAKRYPSELSGGQQQRIALARAIVANPTLILFDEPLSNLDANLRSELRDEISRLHELYKFTGIYVTHDRGEALSLGNQVAVMESGHIRQLGTPEEIYGAPSTAYVAAFLGANVLTAEAIEPGFARTSLGEVSVDHGLMAGELMRVAIYPKDLLLEPDAASPVKVEVTRYLGSSTEVSISEKGVGSATALISQERHVARPLVAGDGVRLAPQTQALFVGANVVPGTPELFDAQTGATLLY